MSDKTRNQFIYFLLNFFYYSGTLYTPLLLTILFYLFYLLYSLENTYTPLPYSLNLRPYPPLPYDLTPILHPPSLALPRPTLPHLPCIASHGVNFFEGGTPPYPRLLLI